MRFTQRNTVQNTSFSFTYLFGKIICGFETYQYSSIHHSLYLSHMQYCKICGLKPFPCLSQKLPFVAGGLCIICQCIHVTFTSPDHCRHVTSCPGPNIATFQSFGSSRSSHIPFLLGCTVPQKLNFCLVRSSNKSGEENKLSMYSLCPCRPFFVKRFTIACVVTSVITHVLSFPK
jgi:hypothetical protein